MEPAPRGAAIRQPTPRRRSRRARRSSAGAGSLEPADARVGSLRRARRLPVRRRPLVGSVQPERLKGDYPIIGQRTFFTFTGVSDSLLEGRNLPVPSGVSTRAPAAATRSSDAAASTCRCRRPDVIRSVPRRYGVQSDRLARARAPAFSVNFVNLSEYSGVNADVRRRATRGSTITSASRSCSAKRSCSTWASLRLRLGARRHPGVHVGLPRLHRGARSAGRPGVRHAQVEPHRVQRGVLRLLEKDTNSGFNELHRRHQQVYVANVYIQDFLTPGYTQSVQLPRQRRPRRAPLRHNGFLVRPAPIGVIATQRGPGLLSRLGRQRPHRPLEREPCLLPGARPRDQQPDRRAAQSTSTRRWARSELSIDKDWLRIKGAFFSPRRRRPVRRRGARVRRHRRHPGLRGRPVQPVEPAGTPPGADRHRPQVPVQPAARRCAPTRTKGRRTSSTPASSCSTAPPTSS